MNLTDEKSRISRLITLASWLIHRAYVMMARPMAALSLLTNLAFIIIYAVNLIERQDTAGIPDETRVHLAALLITGLITYAGAKLTHNADLLARHGPRPPGSGSSRLAAAARFTPEACWLFALVAYQVHPEPPLLVPIDWALAIGLLAAVPTCIYLIIRPPRPDPFPKAVGQQGPRSPES